VRWPRDRMQWPDAIACSEVLIATAITVTTLSLNLISRAIERHGHD